MFISAFAAWSCSPGHGAAVPAPSSDLTVTESPQHLVIGGGCFWCVEGVFEQMNGVIDVVSGYAGDSAESARYDLVSAGRTKHAEVVQITYNPTQVSLGTLLQVFFSTHDPTQLNRQGPDRGPQYRSAIFVDNDEQRALAEAYIQELSTANIFSDPIVTTIEPLEAFYPAEGYHQDYVRINPEHPYVRAQALPKIDKVRKYFPDQTSSP